MINDNIELLKFVELHHYDVDKMKSNVYIDETSSNITVSLFLKRRMAICPFCKSNHTIIKDNIKKIINHCIKPKQKIEIIFNQKRFICKDCKHTFMEKNQIGEGISIYGELQMINMLRNPRNTFSDVAKDCFTSITNVINHFDKRVQIQRHPLSKILCFDEIYARRLTETKYSFCMFDPIHNTLIDIVDSRRKNDLEEYFINIPAKERLKVEFVCIDMWQTYVDIAESYLPNATICVDSFHVIEHLNNAINKIRIKTEQKFLHDKDKNRNGYYWLLKKFWYYFVEDFDNIKYERKPKSHYSYLWTKHDVLKKLLSINSDLTEAYRLKEDYREFNLTEDYSTESMTKLEDFIEKFKKSKFNEFKDFGFLLDHWKYYIVNSFIRINGKRMSNGPIESLNSRLKRIIGDANGFTDFERFRNRAMFALNYNEPIKN